MKFYAASLLFLFTFSFLNIGCNKSTTENEVILTEQNNMNVSYGSDPYQKMDVYLPAGRSTENTKVILFIHGGSWAAGDKSDFDTAVPALKQQLKDYALVNMNYRLAQNGINRFPAQMEDIQAAINTLVSNSNEYHINANKIVLVGASAGAHLALLQAYKYNSSGRIKAVIDLFGPTDLVTLYNNHPFPAASQPVLVNLLGYTPTTNLSLYKDASPINYVTPASVPTQIFHGGADFVVPIVQSTTLKTKLESANVKVEMVVYPTEGHGWFGANLYDTYAKVVTFLQQNVQ